MNEGVIASSDFKIGKNGRKYPAKRIHMGEKEKQQVTEASYKGNIGVMELAKFHSSASAADKEHFTHLMKKKSEAKTDHEQQQMASQIWDHIQKTTGTKLHQMESVSSFDKESIRAKAQAARVAVDREKKIPGASKKAIETGFRKAVKQDYKKADKTMTEMLSFATMLESKDDFILQTLADRDINASIKDGKVVVHDHTQHTKAKNMVKRMGMPHEVVKGMKEDLDESIDWHKHNGDWTKAKEEGKKIFNDTMAGFSDTVAGVKDKTNTALRLKTKAWEEHKKGSYIGAVVRGHVDDYFDRDLRDDVNVDDTATVVQEAMPTHEFNKLVRGYLTHKKAAKVGGFKPMTMDQYKRTSVKALSVKEDVLDESKTYNAKLHSLEVRATSGTDRSLLGLVPTVTHGEEVDMSTEEGYKKALDLAHQHGAHHFKGKYQIIHVDHHGQKIPAGSVTKARRQMSEETIEELSKGTLDSYSKKAEGKEKQGRSWQRMSGLIRAQMKKNEKVNEDQKVVVPVPKPRNPNQGILANKKNAAGMHVDKKKKMKMGNDKHKARVFEETNDE